MLYVDTSLLIPLLTVESMSSVVEDWFFEQPVEDLLVPDWVVTETAVSSRNDFCMLLHTGVSRRALGWSVW